MVNGVAVQKAIQACSIPITGSSGFTCSSSYSVDPTQLPTGYYTSASWSISPSSLSSGLTSSTITGSTAAVIFSKEAAGVYGSGYAGGNSATLNFSFTTTENGQTVTHYCAPKSIAWMPPPAPSILGVYVNGTAPAPITTGMTGVPYVLKASAANSVQYKWEYSKGGSNPTYTATSYSTSTTVSFPAAGTYTVKLQLNDGCAWTAPVSTTFTVQDLYTLSPNPVYSPTLTATRNTAVTAPASYGYAEIVSASGGSAIMSQPFAWSDAYFTFNVSSLANNAGYYLIIRMGGSGSGGQLIQSTYFVKVPDI
jgi:hypothetical protein